MQRFRYFTRIGDIETSSDVDIILKEDNCLLLVNRGNFFVPHIVYARKEQGIVIEKEQFIELKHLADLLFEYSYLPVYYMGFSKGNMNKLKKDVNVLKANYEKSKDSDEGQYNDYLKDLKRNREKWLLRQASVDKVRNSFEHNIKSNNISYITKEEKRDINDIIDQALGKIEEQRVDSKPKEIDELEFVPKKKVKN
jgi:hypothetical protein